MPWSHVTPTFGLVYSILTISRPLNFIPRHPKCAGDHHRLLADHEGVLAAAGHAGAQRAHRGCVRSMGAMLLEWGWGWGGVGGACVCFWLGWGVYLGSWV